MLIDSDDDPLLHDIVPAADDLPQALEPAPKRRKRTRPRKKPIPDMCCERGCSLKYSPAKVLQLRLQTQFLARGNLRAWVQERTVMTKATTGVCADDRNFDKKHCTYRLELPAVLEGQSFTQKHGCQILDSNSQSVCVPFLCFVLDKSTNFLYQPGHKHSRAA